MLIVGEIIRVDDVAGVLSCNSQRTRTFPESVRTISLSLPLLTLPVILWYISHNSLCTIMAAGRPTTTPPER
jgi:hypothetical protein